jgi:hypothetical protein
LELNHILPSTCQHLAHWNSGCGAGKAIQRCAGRYVFEVMAQKTKDFTKDGGVVPKGSGGKFSAFAWNYCVFLKDQLMWR